MKSVSYLTYCATYLILWRLVPKRSKPGHDFYCATCMRDAQIVCGIDLASLVGVVQTRDVMLTTANF